MRETRDMRCGLFQQARCPQIRARAQAKTLEKHGSGRAAITRSVTVRENTKADKQPAAGSRQWAVTLGSTWRANVVTRLTSRSRIHIHCPLPTAGCRLAVSRSGTWRGSS